MIWRNTHARYGGIAAGFHWIVALLVIGLLGLGLYMADLPPSPSKLTIYGWHKSFGITVLGLAALRLLWRLTNLRPDPLSTHKSWEKGLAHLIHFLLYLSLFVMPLSGWVMSSAKGYAVNVFGWFTLPHLTGESKELARLAVQVHETTAWILISMVCLHLAGALKHHIIDKDSTLRRMMPWTTMILLLAGFFLMSVPARAETVTSWIVDKAQSHLTFEGTQMGAPFTGEFRSFHADIAFDPDNLAASHVFVSMPTKEIATHSTDRDSAITGKEWFDSEAFPEATFTARHFEALDANRYIAHGRLMIKGTEKDVDLPFTLAIKTGSDGHKTAQVTGELTLQRLDFNIGSGEWIDTKAVGNQVVVKLSLTASSAGAAPP